MVPIHINNGISFHDNEMPSKPEGVVVSKQHSCCLLADGLDCRIHTSGRATSFNRCARTASNVFNSQFFYMSDQLGV